MKYLLILFLSLSLFADDRQSLLLKESESPYFKYMKELVVEKKLSKDSIKLLLETNKRTITGNVLRALDLDFNKKEFHKAMFYYEEILSKVPDKVKNTTESFYLADYLVRMNKYDKIETILDVNYCESLINKTKKDKCFYYMYIGTKQPILLEKIENEEWRLLLWDIY